MTPKFANSPFGKNDRFQADEEIPVLPRNWFRVQKRGDGRKLHYNTDRERWEFLAEIIHQKKQENRQTSGCVFARAHLLSQVVSAWSGQFWDQSVVWQSYVRYFVGADGGMTVLQGWIFITSYSASEIWGSFMTVSFRDG